MSKSLDYSSLSHNRIVFKDLSSHIEIIERLFLVKLTEIIGSMRIKKQS